MIDLLRALAPAQAALGLLFVFSGIAKLRSPGSAATAMDALGLKRLASSKALTEAFPYLELLLGAALLLGWFPWLRVLACAAALLLLLAMTVLVTRAVRSGSQKSCNCFGSSEAIMSVWTVRRNYGFILLAILALASAFFPLPLASFWAVLGGALVLLAAAASAYSLAADQLKAPATAEAGTAPLGSGLPAEAGEDDEYVRRPNPAVVLEDLRRPGVYVPTTELYAQNPVLVLNVSGTCGSCFALLEKEEEIVSKLPFPVVYVFSRYTQEIPEKFASSELPMYRDMTDSYTKMSRSTGVPAATLMGADGLLAGGPEMGRDAIMSMVDEIAEVMREQEIEAARLDAEARAAEEELQQSLESTAARP